MGNPSLTAKIWIVAPLPMSNVNQELFKSCLACFVACFGLLRMCVNTMMLDKVTKLDSLFLGAFATRPEDENAGYGGDRQ